MQSSWTIKERTWHWMETVSHLGLMVVIVTIALVILLGGGALLWHLVRGCR